jgi:hypothetical protein
VPRICIATVTWARNEQEHQLLRESLVLLAGRGFPIVVADRDSGTGLRDFLASRPQFRLVSPRGPSLVGQIQASLGEAARTDAEFILYTESDKALFFEKALKDFVGRADLGDRTGAVLAARSEASFATFPPLQQFTERTINQLCGEFVGAPGDYSYGPFLLHRALVPRLGAIPSDAGWGWRHFIFAAAARAGYSISHIAGDYPCPPDQREETDVERLHRVRQLQQNIHGLLLGMAQRGRD